MRVETVSKYFLEALLGIKIRRIVYINKEQEAKESADGHGIRMDIYLETDDNTVYCIEMQRYGGEIYLSRRVRYYQGIIDIQHLGQGEEYETLPESFIIIICDFDPFGRDLAVYKRTMSLEGCEGLDYTDGTHVFFLNCNYKVPNAAQPILEYLDCVRLKIDTPEHYDSQLMKTVCQEMKRIRGNEELRESFMSIDWYVKQEKKAAKEEGIKEGREEGIKEGKEEGIKEGKIKSLMNCIEEGFLTVEQAALSAKMSIEQFIEAAKKYDGRISFE